MKNTIVLLLLASIAYLSQCLYPSFNSKEERQEGKWSEVIAPHIEFGQVPAQYFLCGFGFQEMKWIQTLYNCNCKKVILLSRVSWQCQWCDNNMWTMTSGFKAKFCHYKNWTQQTILSFQTGNPQAGGWKQYTCPNGSYAINAANRFAIDFEVDLGFNGLKLMCQNRQTKTNSYIQDTFNYQLSSFPQVKKGKKISGLKLKYEEGGKLTGVQWFWEGAAIISEVSVKYLQGTQTTKASTKIVETINFSNSQYTTAKKPLLFTTPFSYSYRCTTDMKILNEYMIMNTVKVDPVYLKTHADLDLSPYHSVTVQPFNLESNITVKYTPKPKTSVFIPSFFGVQYISKIDFVDANVLFEANVTFIDQETKQEIMKKTINGVWSGPIASYLYVDQQFYSSLFVTPCTSQLKFIPDPNKKYQIKTALDPDKMALDVSYSSLDHDNLIVWDTDKNAPHQQFNLKPLNGNKFSITTYKYNINNNLFIGDSSTSNTGRLTIGPEKKKQNQYFQLVPASVNGRKNAFYIKTFCGKALSTQNGKVGRDVRIFQNDFTGEKNQIFILEEVK